MRTDPNAGGPIAVLGSSGFLGHAVLRVLCSQRPHRKLIEVGRSTTSTPGVAFVRVDGARPGSVATALREVAPMAVISCAALARGGDCAREPELAQRLNGELPGEVASVCAALGARFVHVSTDLVFGGTSAPPGGFREEARPEPLDVYGASKAAGESAVLRADGRALVARLPLLFGDSAGRGGGASESLINDLSAGREVVLFDDEWRTPLDVDLAARALVRLLEIEVAGLVHLPGPERLTRAEFGRRIATRAGLDASVIRCAPRSALGLEATRPADVTLNGDRARLLLGNDWNVERCGRP